jgi:hypothetical protein
VVGGAPVDLVAERQLPPTAPCVSEPGVIRRFVRRWRHVANRFEQATRVKPIDPRRCGEFHGFEMAPRAEPSAKHSTGRCG